MDNDQRLNNNTYCNVATVCADGSPWNSPLFYVHVNGVLYWWSPLKAVHSQNLLSDNRVFVTVYDSRTPVGKGNGAALYMRCEAGVVEDDELEDVISLFNTKVGVRDFFLSRRNTTSEAPTRLFKAKILQAWENTDGQENGYFIDSRRELPLQ